LVIAQLGQRINGQLRADRCYLSGLAIDVVAITMQRLTKVAQELRLESIQQAFGDA